MKHIVLIFLLPFLLCLGCKEKEEDLISVTELANALDLSVIALEIPEDAQRTKDPFYFKSDNSEGRTEWFGGFQPSDTGSNIKLVTNRKTKEVVVQSGNSQYGYTLDSGDFKHSSGAQYGHVKYSNYMMCFGDSHEAVDVARHPYGIKFTNPEIQAKAENSKWIRYTLVRGSEVPGNAPAHIRRNIERMKQNQSGDGQ